MTNSDGSKLRIGLNGGAELEYQARNTASLSVGAFYSQQGMKGTVEYGNETYNETIKMDYINVP